MRRRAGPRDSSAPLAPAQAFLDSQRPDGIQPPSDANAPYVGDAQLYFDVGASNVVAYRGPYDDAPFTTAHDAVGDPFVGGDDSRLCGQCHQVDNPDEHLYDAAGKDTESRSRSTPRTRSGSSRHSRAARPRAAARAATCADGRRAWVPVVEPPLPVVEPPLPVVEPPLPLDAPPDPDGAPPVPAGDDPLEEHASEKDSDNIPMSKPRFMTPAL